MNKEVTEAEMTILHLLAERPRHGYEIEEVIEARGMREWTAIGFSSIYYLLNKLEKDGGVKRPALAESHLEQGTGGPARKVYQITPAGMAALQGGALASLADAEGDDRSLMLGLANLAVLGKEEVMAALRVQRQGLIERRERVARRAAEQGPMPDFVEVLFDYSQRMMAARLAWLESFMDRIESGRFQWPFTRELFDDEY